MQELSDRKFNTAIMNNVKCYNGNGRQYTRSDTSFQQGNRNCKRVNRSVRNIKTVTEMRDTSKGLISRLNTGKEKKIHDLEGKSIEFIQIERQRPKRVEKQKQN